MIDLSPPPLVFVKPPALLRSIGDSPNALQLELSRSGLPRSVRRQIIKELQRLARSSRDPALAPFLAMPFQPGFRHKAGGGPITTTFVSTQVDAATTKSVFTFSAVSFGASANTDRVVVVGFGFRDNATSRTLSSATIDGAAATIGVQQSKVTGGLALTGFIARVQGTDATGDIVLTFSGVVNRGGGIYVYSCENMQNITATDADNTDTSDPYVGSIDVQAGGVAFASGFSGQGGTNTLTGSGFTADVDNVDIPQAGTKGSCGHGDYASTQTGLAITYDASSNSDSGACFVAYR